MHNQIRVAADRRREVRVAAQVQSEVAVILRGIFGLCLCAQDHFVDKLLGVAALHAGQNSIERFGLEHAAFGERDVERGKEFAQRLHLLHRRLVVHAVDQRHACALQRFSGGDVRQDHELLDQAVGFQPLRRNHAVDGAIGFQQDLAFRADRGRAAAVRYAHASSLRRRRRGGGAPVRPAARVSSSVRPPIASLCLLVGKTRGRTHHRSDGMCAIACGRRRRSPCARPVPRGLRAGATSTDRSRSAPAASARRGRESRPNCRA